MISRHCPLGKTTGRLDLRFRCSLAPTEEIWASNSPLTSSRVLLKSWLAVSQCDGFISSGWSTEDGFARIVLDKYGSASSTLFDSDSWFEFPDVHPRQPTRSGRNSANNINDVGNLAARGIVRPVVDKRGRKLTSPSPYLTRLPYAPVLNRYLSPCDKDVSRSLYLQKFD